MSADLDPRLLVISQPDFDDGDDHDFVQGVFVALMIEAIVVGFLAGLWWLL